jgi:hypothetical protein
MRLDVGAMDGFAVIETAVGKPDMERGLQWKIEKN